MRYAAFLRNENYFQNILHFSLLLSLYHSNREQFRLYFYKIRLIGNDGVNILVSTRCLLHVILTTDCMNDAFCFKVAYLCIHIQGFDCCFT